MHKISERFNLTGKRIGRLTVIRLALKSELKPNQGGSRYWLTKCDCGTEKIKNGVDFKGLINAYCSKNCKLCPPHNRRAYGESARKGAYYAMKANAAQRRSIAGGIVWDLSYEKFLELTGSPCYYCGIEFSQRSGQDSNYGHYYHNGIDRVDNAKGYTLENSIPACWNCNRAKNDLSFDDFKKHIIQMYEHLVLGKKNLTPGESVLDMNRHTPETVQRMRDTAKRLNANRIERKRLLEGVLS